MFKRFAKPTGKVCLRQRSLLQNGATHVLSGAVRTYAEYNEPPDTNPPPLCRNKKKSGNTCGGPIKDEVCGEKIEKPVKKQEDGFQFHHLIAYPRFCCEDICADEYPRFDDCLYKPSDKNRPYQQTWVECPPIQIKPKKICCFEKGIPPKIERRKPKKIDPKCDEPPPCGTESGACPKIRMPGCKDVALQVGCKKEKRKAYCTKVRTPYPAYSECKHSRIKPRRARECECLQIPPMCFVYELLRRYEKIGRSPTKCP